MTEVEHLEVELTQIQQIKSYLEDRLKVYRGREKALVMKINRARRLEREAKELPNV